MELEIKGLNGKIKFHKSGPEGKESGQSMPNVYLIKIDNGKVVIPQDEAAALTESGAAGEDGSRFRRRLLRPAPGK